MPSSLIRSSVVRHAATLSAAAFGVMAPLAARADAPPAVASVSTSIQASKTEARKLSDLYVDIAERVSTSVVQIETTVRDDATDTSPRKLDRPEEKSPVARGTGSGVIYSADGLILTNNHVIEDALSINVRLRDGRFLPARLIGRDPGTDIAVIKVDATGITPAAFVDSDSVRTGELVVAIGSPFGLQYSITAGNLSAKGRGSLGANPIEDYLQTSANLYEGNSGGALCNLDAKVMGINTMVVDKASGIGFAIPSNLARRVADQLIKNGRVRRAWVGLGVQDLTPDLAKVLKLEPAAGALVNAVTESGPALKANLKPGDVIISIAGKATHDGADVQREVLMHDVGEAVPLEVLRGGQHYGTQVTLAPRPEPAVPPIPMQQRAAPAVGLGLDVRELSQEQATRLNLPVKPLPAVTRVYPGSAADRAGLRVGDVIIEADGIQEPTVAQLQQAGSDGQLFIRVRRRDVPFYAVVKK